MTALRTVDLSAMPDPESFPGSAAPAFLHPDFLALAGDEASAQALRAFAREHHWPPATVLRGDSRLLAGLPLRDGVPRLVVVDLDSEEEPLGFLAGLAARIAPGGRLIAIGRYNDVGFYRQVLAAGATEYLVKPLTADALRQIDGSTAQGTRVRQGGVGDGRLTVVIGARGGVGASTIAVNAAWLLAHEFKLGTALLDLDLQFGSSALALDLEPGRGLRDALSAPDRLDSLLLTSSLVAQSERLCVLGAEEPVDEALSFDPQGLQVLFRELRASFDAVVAEVPRQLVPAHRRALAEADAVVLVSDLTLVGIRDTVRLADAITATGGPARVLCVASRVGRDRKGQVDAATFEKGIRSRLAAVIPDEPRSIATAANQGKALAQIDRAGPVTAALRGLAQQLSGGAAPPPAGLVQRLQAKLGLPALPAAMRWLVAGRSGR